MHAVLTTVPTLAVSAVYCLWHVYRAAHCQRRQKLRARVTYMLWVMATSLQSDE